VSRIIALQDVLDKMPHDAENSEARSALQKVLDEDRRNTQAWLQEPGVGGKEWAVLGK
jgi:cell division FtsZ-interacting protein ZapD